MRFKLKTCGGVATLFLLLFVSVSVANTDLSLVEAVKQRDAETVVALLKQQVDVNAPQPDGATPLHWAAHWDDVDTAGASDPGRGTRECDQRLRCHTALGGMCGRRSRHGRAIATGGRGPQ